MAQARAAIGLAARCLASMSIVCHANADTVDARCDIYPKGEGRASASQPCTFSQRQGYIRIQREDGISHDLSPGGDKPGNYVDQSGASVYRQGGLGDAGLVFRMPAESVFVYWDATSVQASGSGSDPDSGSRHAATPSFDCSRASNAVEELVCADAALAALDRRLADVYATARSNFPAEELDSLKSGQRDWIRARNACPGRDARGACVRHRYETRITELQIQGGDLMVPSPVHYRCGDDQYNSLTAVFYQDTILPAVALTRWSESETQQVIAFLGTAGSGARYQHEDVVFWIKGKEVMLTWGGMEAKCIETGRGGGV